MGYLFRLESNPLASSSLQPSSNVSLRLSLNHSAWVINVHSSQELHKTRDRTTEPPTAHSRQRAGGNASNPIDRYNCSHYSGSSIVDVASNYQPMVLQIQLQKNEINARKCGAWLRLCRLNVMTALSFSRYIWNWSGELDDRVHTIIMAAKRIHELRLIKK